MSSSGSFFGLSKGKVILHTGLGGGEANDAPRVQKLRRPPKSESTEMNGSLHLLPGCLTYVTFIRTLFSNMETQLPYGTRKPVVTDRING